MASNQSDDQVTTEPLVDLVPAYGQDALGVEREARAEEREARALEAEVRRNEPALVPTLRDLLAGIGADVVLAQALLDEHPDDWDQRGLVERVQKQLDGIAAEVRASIEASGAPDGSRESAAARKGASAKN